jgi:uncharacterized protein
MSMIESSSRHESILLPGPAGNLQAMLSQPAARTNHRAMLICHPHPLHGGSMDNKVVTSCARAALDSGMPALRFNFRGVGESQGRFDEGRGEGEDLLAAASFLRERFPQHDLVLAGFSFGAVVSMLRAVQVGPRLLISLAPAVERIDPDALQVPQCPWLILQPDADEVIDAQAVYRFQQRYAPGAVLHKLAAASHFFHGRLLELRQHIADFLIAHP